MEKEYLQSKYFYLRCTKEVTIFSRSRYAEGKIRDNLKSRNRSDHQLPNSPKYLSFSVCPCSQLQI